MSEAHAGGSRPRLVLVGPPGAGKSTVGALVATALGATFRDTDDDVAARAGRSVPDIFVQLGEPAFREMERAAVAQALSSHPGVLALGGGAVADADTRAALAGHRVAFLDVSLADALRRLGMNRDRPLLVGNLRAQWLHLMDQRRPWYTEVATWAVATDGRAPQDVADELLRLLAVAV